MFNIGLNKNENLAGFSDLLNSEIKIAFEKVSFFSGLLGYMSAILLLIFDRSGLAEGLLVPAVWAAIASTYALFAYFATKKGYILGLKKYLIVMPYIFLPSIIYIISYFVNPSRTATYITGPPSYLYIFIIIVTGFFLDGTLSVISGILAAVQYFVIYLMAREYLMTINSPYTLMIQDMTGLPIYFFKSVMMVFCGIGVGILSSHARSLIDKILNEEKEKLAIDRLFGQYVSKAVKDKVVNEKKDVIGERKQVAVLFSDIRSFTTYSESNNPELIVTQLNEYFDKMIQAVNRNGGVVDKFIGDAVMAVFGGVLKLDNCSSSAVAAALDMQQGLSELNKKWAEAGIKPFVMGIGVHYGEVVQGTIGSSERKEFTVIGDTVNTASRLEQLTKEYSADIVISEETYKMISDEYKSMFENIGQSKLKGKNVLTGLYGLK